MAVGGGLDLTMPILARINFLLENDPNLFYELKKNLIGPYLAIFDQNGLPHGSLTTLVAIIFKNIPPLNFDFVQENFLKSQNCLNLGRLANTPICPKWPIL